MDNERTNEFEREPEDTVTAAEQEASFASPAEREEGQRAATTAPSARSVCARPRYRCSAGWQALPQL